MDFFRAVPREGFDADKIYSHQATRRLPSNVPYLIDNIWEYLRPTNRPSRRHAVYASPSPELALENASAGHLKKEDYMVCRLRFATTPAFMQLSVTDARHHPDIKSLQKVVHGILGVDFGSLPLQSKFSVAPLFVPGVSASELDQCLQLNQQVMQILLDSAKVSTIWHGGQELDPSSPGELFFELKNSNSYVLEPL